MNSPCFSRLTRHSSSGFALLSALILVLLISFMVAMLSHLSRHNMSVMESNSAKEGTYLAAEGAVNKQIAEISVLSTLWSQKTNLPSLPNAYTEFSPSSYLATNGIPECSGLACHRSLYPTGGGLIKNFGPINGAGDTVNTSYRITDQLDPDSTPTPDVTLGSVNAWTQVERLDQLAPGASTVGGSLSNAVAEGGNALTVRYRITGLALRDMKDRRGYSTVIAVVEMPTS